MTKRSRKHPSAEKEDQIHKIVEEALETIGMKHVTYQPLSVQLSIMEMLSKGVITSTSDIDVHVAILAFVDVIKKNKATDIVKQKLDELKEKINYAKFWD